MRKARTDKGAGRQPVGRKMIMDKNKKRTVEIMVIGAVLLAAALNIGRIGTMLMTLMGLVMPVAIGALIAFVMNVPMKGFEKLLHRLSGKLKKGIPEKRIALISMWLTVISLILVIALVIVLVVPEIVASLESLYRGIESAVPAVVDFLEKHVDPAWVDINWIQENVLNKMEDTNISKMILRISNGAYDALGMVFTFATTTVGMIMSITMDFIVALYILLSKKKLVSQSKKLLYAFLKKPVADKVCHVGKLVNDTYAKFLSGQCVEAFIIAILLFIAFTCFRLPYASLVGVLAGVLSFIPYIGSWLACGIGVLLILMMDPWKALLAFVVYQAVQFLEGQLIYPRVVGSSVGLPPLYTLLAALLGGKLFGIVGIIFIIPLVAVIYMLVKETTDNRLKRKGMAEEEKQTP